MILPKVNIGEVRNHLYIIANTYVRRATKIEQV